jgi:tetratricopeptide (TPR) repeat protein
MTLPKIFKNKSKEELLQQAIDLKENGQIAESIKLYKKIIRLYPSWAIPFYNLGLIHKYRCEWTESFEYNKKACDLNPDDEASQWNLGISATALKDWKEARMAWNHFGLKLDINSDEPNVKLGRTPIRLNPESNGEVVWGLRIDPARTIIENVPFPESNHRYQDLILTDGAAVGHRISNGK